jgi:hypothetical protein
VDRLVRVHQLAVAHGHLAQCVLAVQALVQAVEGDGLPAGAVAALDAAALGDAGQAVAVDRVDAPALETRLTRTP